MPIHLRVESLVQGMMMEITQLTMISDKSDKNKKDKKDKNMQQICSPLDWVQWSEVPIHLQVESVVSIN